MIKNILKRLIIVLVAVIQNSSLAQTTIADNTNIGGTWTVTNSPYIIQGRAIIPEDSTLVIQPGVVVKFTSSTGSFAPFWDYTAANIGVLRVKGKIVALGTTTDSITFTHNGAASGYWGCVLVDSTADTTSQFQYCKFEYAKYTRNVPGITSVVSFGGALSFFGLNLSVSNCTFANNADAGINCFETDEIEISNCNISNNGFYGLYAFKSNIKLINSVVTGNSFGATGFIGAVFCAKSNSQIIGNLIANNDDFGIYADDSTTLIVNNTIYGNFQGIRTQSGGLINIYNTIITNNTSDFATSSATATINLYNSMVGSTSLPAEVNNITGNILNGNPQFVDVVNGNFTLLPTSLCIDAGTSTINQFTMPLFDLTGNLRISGLQIDMGAIEYQNSVGIIENNNNEIALYPNPSNGSFSIASDIKVSHIKVVNMLGAVVYSSGREDDLSTIELSNQPNGLYFVHIIHEKGTSIEKLVLKK